MSLISGIKVHENQILVNGLPSPNRFKGMVMYKWRTLSLTKLTGYIFTISNGLLSQQAFDLNSDVLEKHIQGKYFFW